jgi:hypothetical protein
MRRLLALAACALLAACGTTTDTRVATATAIGKPAANAKVVVVQPDVQLSILNAAGMQEPRADWSQTARANLAAALESELKAKSHPIAPLDPSQTLEGRPGQILRLHDAVGQSIMAFNYGYVNLPTKKGDFDWTLGEGARALGESTGADYALFSTVRGSYSSGGRKAVVAVGMLLGVGMPLGGQQAFTSLVDLKTGRVVWFNVARAGSSDDVRSREGAQVLAASLLEGAPL